MDIFERKSIMKIDLHTHTDHSFNGEISVADLVAEAERNQFDALAITDHGNMSAVGIAQNISRILKIIPGMEVSTRTGCHVIGLFLQKEISSNEILDVLDEIHEQGGLTMLPHPFRQHAGLIYGREKKDTLDSGDLQEIMARIDLVEMVCYGSTTDEFTETEKFFSSYCKKPLVSGSNTHSNGLLGKAYMELETSKSKSLESIKKALLNGPRLIRYEAYDSEPGHIAEKLISSTIAGHNFLPKAVRLFQRRFKNSLKAVYSKSTGLKPGNKQRRGNDNEK
jgi:predicted metal-dependent phosphoesterase TrpH